MAFPRSPTSTVSSYASTLTLSSCPSSAISRGSSNPAISPSGIWFVVPPARHPGDHNPAQAATGAPSKLLKNVSTSIREIHRWARSSSTGSKVNSNIRLLESVFYLIQVVTSTAPHPDHIVAMIRVHDALANLLLVLPKNIFPFLEQNSVPFVDELSPRRGAPLPARFGNTLHDLQKSIRSGLQVLKTMILDYTSEAVPQGGGIHEITKYLLKYIMSLLDNGSSLKIILVSGEQDGRVAMETLENNKNKAPKLMKYTPEDLEELLSDLGSKPIPDQADVAQPSSGGAYHILSALVDTETR